MLDELVGNAWPNQLHDCCPSCRIAGGEKLTDSGAANGHPFNHYMASKLALDVRVSVKPLPDGRFGVVRPDRKHQALFPALALVLALQRLQHVVGEHGEAGHHQALLNVAQLYPSAIDACYLQGTGQQGIPNFKWR